MNANPLVTVAIPSYNHGKYIAETIQSALDQTFQDFEILIVDDASTDNSLEVIKSFNNPRIRLIELKENLGVCETSNVCIKESRGKYIALIASDDVMIKDKLEKQVTFLENNPAYGAVFSGIIIINENGRINEKKTKKCINFFEKENRSRFKFLNYFFHNGNCLAATTLMARKEALQNIGSFRPEINQAHDFDLWIRFCLSGYEIFIIKEKLLKYREREGQMNMSSNTSKTRAILVYDNEKVLENYLELESIELLKKIFPNVKIPESIGANEERAVIKYCLFSEAIRNQHSFSHRQFAANLIYKIFSNKNDREVVRKIYGLNSIAYSNLIASNPLGQLVENKLNPRWKKTLKLLERKFKKLLLSR